MVRVAREKISCHSNGGASRITAVGFGGNSLQLAVRKATIKQLIIHTLRIVRSAESIYCFNGSVFPHLKIAPSDEHWTVSNTVRGLWAHESVRPNWLMIGSAIFAQLISVPSTQTH